MLQELTLSRRIVHFSNGKMYWDCPHISQPRSIGFKTDHSAQMSPSMKKLDTHIDFVDSWLDIVSDYSKCELTYRTDKLAAISGIAAEWQTHLEEGPGRSYHFGLFQCGMPQSFLWYTSGGPLTSSDQQVPSWSWASVDGHVQHMKTRNARVDAVTISVNDSVAPGHSGRGLVLRVAEREGWIKPTTVEFGHDAGNGILFIRPKGVIIRGYELSMNGYASYDSGVINYTERISCARICTYHVNFDGRPRDLNLVLLLEKAKQLCYKRVGVGIIYEHGWFDNFPLRDITIV